MGKRGKTGIIYADDLRDFMNKSRETAYQLVDVREPGEYKKGHIPGAKLIPLREIEDRLNELDPERTLLFYCASGARSRMATAFVADSPLGPKAIYNVEGGIHAWDGKEIEDFPRVKLFEGIKGIDDILITAIDFEKGAWRFYSSVMDTFPESSFAPAAKSLVKLEKKHAQVLYKILRKRSRDKPMDVSFEELFENLKGEFLEGGESVQGAVQQIGSSGDSDCLSFVELALDIEYRAYDLYRNLSYETEDTDDKHIFLSLSEQEKGHARVIARNTRLCDTPPT